MAEATEPDRTPTAPATSGPGRPVPSPAGDTTAPARRTAAPPVRGNGRPASPAEMRQEIERTRARMTETLDALEARIEHERRALDRKKRKVVDGVTLKRLRRKLKKEPWRSIAISFAAGYIIAAIRD